MKSDTSNPNFGQFRLYVAGFIFDSRVASEQII